MRASQNKNLKCKLPSGMSLWPSGMSTYIAVYLCCSVLQCDAKALRDVHVAQRCVQIYSGVCML